jgi:hypothetical protein
MEARAMDTDTSIAIDALRTDIRRVESTLGDGLEDARRHAQVVFENLRDDIRMIAEGVVSIDAKVGSMDVKLGSIEGKVASMDVRLGSVETTVASLDVRASSIETKVTTLDTKATSLDTKVGALDAKVDALGPAPDSR